MEVRIILGLDSAHASPSDIPSEARVRSERLLFAQHPTPHSARWLWPVCISPAHVHARGNVARGR